MLPDCPKCHADARHVQLIVIVVFKTGATRTDYACNCCGHGWSVTDRSADGPPIR